MTQTEIKPLSLSMDEELRTTSNNVLDGYTISNRGIIYDPEGNKMTPHGYRGKPVVGVKGYMVFIDYAVAKIFLGGHRLGKYIRHIDGDLTNCDVDNLEWKERSNYTYERKKKDRPALERPEGWIRRYTPDGILVREYKDIDQLLYEVTHFNEVSSSELYTIVSCLRRHLQGVTKTFLNCRWEVSDNKILDSRKFGLHPEKYEGTATTMEYTPATPTWIKRYCGPWLIQTFENIDEAVECIIKHNKIGRTAQRIALRHHCRKNDSTAPATILGCRWEASGEEALISAHSESGRPKKQTLPPAPAEVEETLNPIEPIVETPKKKTIRKPTTPTKEESSRPTFEIDFIGDMAGAKVEVRRIDNFVRLRITL